MVGKKIRYYRKKKGLTLEELSEGICSISYLSKIERGEKSSQEIVDLICIKLGIVNGTTVLETKKKIYSDIYEIYKDIKENKYIKSQKLKRIYDECILQNDMTLLSFFYLIKFRVSLKPLKTEDCIEMIENLELLKVHFNDEFEFYYMKFKGLYYYLNQDYSRSIKYYISAKSIWPKIYLNQIEIAEIYFQLSLLYIKLDQIPLSLYYSNNALKIYQNEYLLIETAECQMLLGISYRKIELYNRSQKHFQNVYTIATMTNNLDLLSSYHHNMGYLLSSQRKFSEAIIFYENAIEIRNGLNKKHNNILSKYLLANALIHIGKVELAKIWIKKGLLLCEELGNVQYFYHLSILERKLTPEIDYKDFLKEAIKYFTDIQMNTYVADYSELLGQLYEEEFLYKEASKFYCLANNMRKVKEGE